MKTTNPTAERLRAVTLLYTANWTAINEAALESNPNLTAADAYECISQLENKLNLYPDRLKLTDTAFCQWAANVLEAPIFICALKSETEPYVFKAIYQVLANCSDLGVNLRTAHELGTVDEIASDTWVWALKHIDDLKMPGTAKLTTRMYDRARWQARAWKTEQLRAKARYASMDDYAAIEEEQCA